MSQTPREAEACLIQLSHEKIHAGNLESLQPALGVQGAASSLKPYTLPLDKKSVTTEGVHVHAKRTRGIGVQNSTRYCCAGEQ